MGAVDSGRGKAVRSFSAMRPLVLAAGAIAGLLLLAVPLRTSAGGSGNDWGVALDGGCRVRLDARPTSGLGCHIHWQEPDPDSGVPVEGIAAVACDGTFEICGETVRCHCPDW
jgi:hypothetical protein